MNYDLTDEKTLLLQKFQELEKELEVVRKKINDFSPATSSYWTARTCQTNFKHLRFALHELREFGAMQERLPSGSELDRWYKEPIYLLDLSTNACNLLTRHKIEYVDELLEALKEPQKLLEIRGFGQKTLAEVQSALDNFVKNPKARLKRNEIW